jgi:hypothetical protein
VQPVKGGVGRGPLHGRETAQVLFDELIDLVAMLGLLAEQSQDQQLVFVHASP